MRVATVSDAIDSVLCDSKGNLIGSIITTNGTYYADVSGCTSLYFAITRTLQEGAATVKWVLTPILTDLSTSNYLSRISDALTANSLLATETFELDAVKDLKYYKYDINKYKCICLNVSSITNDALISCRISTYAPIPIFDSEGNIYKYISKTGIYYFPINYPSNFAIRNNIAIEGGSLTIRPYLLNEFPKHLLEIKPIQLIASKVITIDKSTLIIAFQNKETTLIKYFKYYYICYQIKNNNTSVGRHMLLQAQPYNFIICNNRTLLEADSYSNQTDWQEVNAIEGLQVYITVNNYQEGDTVEIKIIGIR